VADAEAPEAAEEPDAPEAQDGDGADQADGASTGPDNAKLVLLALILVAAVANLNLAVANVALPDIGKAFSASQTQLNLVAVGYSLGLAASVLYLGALGDRYGRKMMLVLGVALSIPACILAATAGSVEVLIGARILGGLSAGMAFPTTLALITALWSGPARTRSIALWSGLGGAISALGPLASGYVLGHWYWGSVFLLTLPLAVVALVLAIKLVPSHVKETTESVNHLGGIISILLVGCLVLSINFFSVPDERTFSLEVGAAAVALVLAFYFSQRFAKNPLFDLHIAGRRVFWVAAVAGIIVFGSLMGAMFIGQQFLQNVLGYSTLESGASILPAVVFMVIVAPRSAKLVESHGARFTLLVGYVFCFLGFLAMYLTWDDGTSYTWIGLAYALVGIGVGFAGTPASHSLTGSVPVTRAGMASGTADLQRDLGGAIMQSILGTLLAAGYASAFESQIQDNLSATQQQAISGEVESTLTKSFAAAEAVVEQLPSQYQQYGPQITEAAKISFVDGQDWAYLAGVIAIALGFVLVFLMFPKHDHERRLMARYRQEDGDAEAGDEALLA
jgi:DHA2 family multidrug resistance protein-like MFS transporter